MRKLQTVTIHQPAPAQNPPAARKKNPWDELEAIRTEKVELRKRMAFLNEREKPLRVECHKLLGSVPDDLLTNRENQVFMELLSDPTISNKEIGSKLFIAERTVKFHISSLLQKFGVTDRHQLFKYAQVEGIINEKIDSAGDLTITRAR